MPVKHYNRLYLPHRQLLLQVLIFTSLPWWQFQVWEFAGLFTLPDSFSPLWYQLHRSMCRLLGQLMWTLPWAFHYLLPWWMPLLSLKYLQQQRWIPALLLCCQPLLWMPRARSLQLSILHCVQLRFRRFIWSFRLCLSLISTPPFYLRAPCK